jgi:putative endopeptidase
LEKRRKSVNGGLGEIVGKVYVKIARSERTHDRNGENLLKAYAESIKKLDWMSENTKERTCQSR